MATAGRLTITRWREPAAVPDLVFPLVRPGYCPPGPLHARWLRLAALVMLPIPVRVERREVRKAFGGSSGRVSGAAVQQPRPPHVDRVVTLVHARRLHHERGARRAAADRGGRPPGLPDRSSPRPGARVGRCGCRAPSASRSGAPAPAGPARSARRSDPAHDVAPSVSRCRGRRPTGARYRGRRPSR